MPKSEKEEWKARQEQGGSAAEPGKEAADDSAEMEESPDDVLQDEPLFDLVLPADGERTPEQVMKHALSLAEMAERMQLYYYQDKYLRKALREIKPILGALEEAPAEFNRIRRLMQNARVKHLVQLYRNTREQKEKAKTPEELLYCAEQFEEVDSYQRAHHLNEEYTDPEIFAQTAQLADTLELAAECRRQRDALLGRKQRRNVAALVLAGICLVALFIFSRTTPFLMVKGDLESLLGIHGKAWQAYTVYYRKTGREAAHEKAVAARYRYAVSELSKGSAETVYTDLAELASENYLDSRAYYAAAERSLLTGLAPGDTAKFGKAEWAVLDTEGTRLLLLRKEALPEIPFQEGGGTCTWETSSLRAYLNGAFLAENFTAEEQAMIPESEHPAEDNRLTGTSGGKDTADRLFILSASEAERYQEYYAETKRCWWLRTPGAEPGTMSFVNTDKTVMDYGYEAASGKIRVKLAVWVDMAE